MIKGSAFFWLIATTAHAQLVGGSPTPAPLSAPSTEGILQVMVYFFLLIALLAGGLYFFRNGLAFLPKKNKGPRKLVVSETRALGNRQFLIVAEYEHRKMLLGVCPGRIDYLCTLSGESDETFSTEIPEKPE